MPRISLPIADVYTQVERKVAINMAKTIIKLAALDDDVIVSFPGKGEEQPLQGSRNDKDKGTETPNLSHSSKLSIQFTEEYEEADILTTTVHQINNLNLFADAELGIRMCPVYLPTTGRLTLTYRCEDEYEATQFRDRFRVKCSENRAEFILSSDYEYSMPKQFMLLLYQIWTLRENKAGYGESFSQWFNAHVSDKSTILTNLAGKQSLQAFRERQDNITAWFDFTTPPPINKEQQGAVRTVEFEFHYRYEKPAHMYMQWPIVIHQQLLPKMYRGDGVDKTYAKMEGSMSAINQGMQMFREMDTWPQGSYHGVRVPYFDEWINTTQHRDTSNIITLLVTLDKPDATNTVSLKSLPFFKLKDTVVEYMSKYASRQTIYGKSPFLVTVYENDNKLSERLVKLDSDLTLHFDFVPDLRKTYRLQISLLCNLTILSDADIEELRLNPEMCTMILQAYFPKEKIEVKYIAGKLFPKKILWEYLRRAHRTPKHYLLNQERLLRRVGVFIVDTRRDK